jgi:hypothetical protein
MGMLVLLAIDTHGVSNGQKGSLSRAEDSCHDSGSALEKK